MKAENTAIRLKRLMEERNLKQIDILESARPFCDKYGVKLNKSDLSQYVSGKVEPGQDKLFILSCALNVSEAWLMGHDVPIEREPSTIRLAKEMLQQKISVSPFLKSGEKLSFLFDKADFDPMIVAYNLEIDQTYIDSWIKHDILPPSPIVDKILACVQESPRMFLNDNEYAEYLSGKYTPANIIPVPHTTQIPLIGTIACGTPLLAEENLEGPVDLPEQIRADFALRCKGDSMITARIFDGDIVYIRRQPQVDNGKIAAVRLGDEATLKRIFFFPSEPRLVLRPCNPLYSDMVYTGDELSDIEILGEAVAFTSIVRHE